jgi:hypothetical protein
MMIVHHWLRLTLAASALACSTAPSAPAPPVTFVTTTYQQGSKLFLQNATPSDTVRIGLDTAWGGSIVELSLDGTNYVNAHDPGREVQVSYYDGNAHYDLCAGCSGVFGWNPVQAGDRYAHGAATSSFTRGAASLYTSVRPLQWYPDDKGGGPAQPVVSDVIIEQTVMPVPDHAAAFHVHWVLTHLGADLHANAHEELPAVYANAEFPRFVYYGGNAPFTNGAVSVSHFNPVGQPVPLLYSSEPWAAYVNAQNMGLTVYAPSQLPWVVGFTNPGPGGPTGDGTNYFSPWVQMTITPGFTQQGDYYVIAGDYRAARQVVYSLHQAGGDPDISTPLGAINAPAGGITIGGVAAVIGWAVDNVSVASVQIVVDGVTDGAATYGVPRPDVATDFANAPVNVGFTYSLNTAKYANGAHVLTARVTDPAGNIAIFPGIAVIISN